MVRSKRLAAGTASAIGFTVLYTCPASTIAIVKSMAARNRGGAALTFYAGVQALGSGVQVDFHTFNALAASASDYFAVYIALNPTDTLFLALNGAGTIDYWVSGVELL